MFFRGTLLSFYESRLEIFGNPFSYVVLLKQQNLGITYPLKCTYSGSSLKIFKKIRPFE